MDKLAGKAGIFAPSIYCIIMQATCCICKLNKDLQYKSATPMKMHIAVALAGLKKEKI
jgi:hypothetical protein